MKHRWLFVMMVTVLLAMFATACMTSPSITGSSTTLTTTPPELTCSIPGPRVVIYAGDSLVGQWPQYMQLPIGSIAYNTAKGGAGYTAVNPEYNIGARLLRQLDVCDNNVGMVIVSGGINDLAVDQPVQGLIDAVSALSTELASRGVRVVWLPITPFALYPPSLSYDHRYDSRLEYNAWLSSGGVVGDIIDCNPSLRDAYSAVEALNPNYWSYTPGVDRWHLNQAGYRAFASCLSPAIAALP